MIGLWKGKNNMQDLVRNARIHAILANMDLIWEDIELYRRIGDSAMEAQRCEDLLLAQQRLAEATQDHGCKNL